MSMVTKSEAVVDQAAHLVPLSALVPWERNPRDNDAAARELAVAIVRFGWTVPAIVRRTDRRIIAGHTRRKAALLLPGMWSEAGPKRRKLWHPDAVRLATDTDPAVPVRYVDNLTDAEADALSLADNKLGELADWNTADLNKMIREMSASFMALPDLEPFTLPGWSAAEMDKILNGAKYADAPSLQDRFVVPPFSVLDARQGYWQDRKREWLAVGLDSAAGRDESLTFVGNRSDRPLDPVSQKLVDVSGGTSVFDPVVCELVYRWFLPPGSADILDPFAGGSVRGAVAALLGHRYTGVDLRPEQVAANEAQWATIAARGPTIPGVVATPPKPTDPGAVTDPAILAGLPPVYDPNELTPVQQVGEYWYKRDDLFRVGDVCGGKTRTVYCEALAVQARNGGVLDGIITGGGKGSRRVNVIAQVARVMGCRARIHTPTGKPTPEMELAMAAGAERITHNPGYTTNLQAQALKDSKALGPTWCYCAFGGEGAGAVEEGDRQSDNLPAEGPKRIVMVAGSAMVLSGLLRGLVRRGINIPVLAVVSGHDPTVQLDRWAPANWRDMCTLQPAEVPFEKPVKNPDFQGIHLDAYFEAKAIPFLRPGDLFWIIGITQAQTIGRLKAGDPMPAVVPTAPAPAPEPVAATPTPCPTPRWVVGDSSVLDKVVPPAPVDLVFSCPPYGDLEVYSDDPRDMSNMSHEAFLTVYRAAIAQAVARLRPDRFAVFVVGDFRDGRGFYRNFVSDTIAAFEAAGARLYNEGILVTSVATVSLRAAGQFTTSRKLGKGHQNVLVFYRGDPKAIRGAFGDVRVDADE